MPLSPGSRVLFVINPISGGQPKASLEQIIKEHCSGKDIITELFTLSGKDDDSSLQYWIKDWKPDMVVAVGGDGTLKLVATALAGTNILTGLIPAGSANGMARELGFPGTPEACLEILWNGDDKTIDLIEINDHLSIHLSDIGMNAQLIKYFEDSDHRGKWGYMREAWRVVANKSQLKATLTLDGKTIQRNALMIVIANASKYGTGAVINPEGDISDGRFEVIVMKRLSLWEILKMLCNVSRFDKRKTEILQAKELTIKLKKPAHFQVDGEYLNKTAELRAEIKPGSLRIVLPVNDAA